MILIYMMVLCTQVNKMYVIATLSVYPHRASLKNMPGHGGIRTKVVGSKTDCSKSKYQVKVYYLKAEFTVNGEHSWLFQNTGS